MKTLFMLLIGTFFSTLPMQGVLPPLYEGIKELQALLASHELSQKLGSGDVIEKIEKTENGYKITTNKRDLEVEVYYTPTGRIGPAAFTLKFGESHER